MKELLLRLFNLEDPETAAQRTADRWIILPRYWIRMHHEMRDCYFHPDDVDSPVDGLLSDQLWGDRYTMFFDSSDPTMIDTGHQNEWADIELPDGSVKRCENLEVPLDTGGLDIHCLCRLIVLLLARMPSRRLRTEVQ